MNQSPPPFLPLLPLLPLIASLSLSHAQQPAGPPPAAPAAPAPPAASQIKLPESEAHIRHGIITLNKLYETLAKINNQQLADSAVVDLLKIQQELIEWGQGFGMLDALSPQDQKRYEEAYLPIIKQINEQIRAQAARLHSARYYDSKDLPTVLIQFVNRVK